MDPEASTHEAPSPAAAAGIPVPVTLPSSAEAPAVATAVTPASIGGSVANATRQSITALMPGFRFHPSDEELVLYYLKRKIYGKSFLFDAITDVDVYDIEPWELQAKGQIKTQDQEWYFFSKLDQKFSHGARMKRSTNEGYWKATGNDRVVKHNNCTVGLKKTLVFHHGRAPGKRTDWVMHEYRLAEEELNKCGIENDLYVLCRIFHKTKIGPPVGNRCAPFDEGEWNDEDAVLPGDVVGEEAAAFEASETEQEYLPSEAATVPHTDILTETGYPLDVYNNETSDLPPALDDRDNNPSILQHKRRKTGFNFQASDYSGRLIQTPQGSGSSSGAKATILEINQSSRLSDLQENTLMESLQQKNYPVPQSPAGASVPDSSLPPEYMGFIRRLQDQADKVSMDRETMRHEVFSVRALNNFLCSRLKKLVKENQELKCKIQDG